MKKICLAAACVAMLTMAAPASANHSWGGYHWARAANPFPLNWDDRVSSAWDDYLTSAATDWSFSGQYTDSNSVGSPFAVDSPVRVHVNSGLAPDKKCRAVSGRVVNCDAAYGRNGWLGIASIWLSSTGHITQGTVKLNDTYYSSGSKYNSAVWRGAVTCQETGHTLGLDHQDETGANLHTCMDYATTPDSWNQHPNRHDFDELGIIYSPLDSPTTAATAPTSAGSGLHKVSDDVYVEDLGNGNRRYVHVYWAQRVPHGPPAED